MSEFGGLWKDQNNPADTQSVRVFRMLKLDSIRENYSTTAVEMLIPVEEFRTPVAMIAITM